MRGLCHHQGGPLAEGELEGNIITCPWHGAKWDVTTGKLSEFAIELDDEPTYKVVEEGDELFIEV
jgi:nitrite reductase/ring-hydroxylating ferredoxin subunit